MQGRNSKPVTLFKFPLQYDEFIETLKSVASNSTAVGIGGISYQMLNRLQSIDSKATKVAIGVPVHTHTNKSYA